MFADASRVLKVPLRGEELTSGFHASLAISGWLGPEVLRSDAASGAILMERVIPGSMLLDSGLSDDQALNVAKVLAGRFRAADPAGFLPLDSYYSRPSALLDLLLATSPPPAPLHADLHRLNILRGAAGWVLIDPKGLLGDPAFEAVAFLRNDLAREADLEGMCRHRVARLADGLGVPAGRIVAWAELDLHDAIDELEASSPWRRLEPIWRKLRLEFPLR